jgi:phosphoribosylanthranilate isomerase
LHLAAHLCGDYCEQALNGNYDGVRELIDLGFKRFQLNPTRANNVTVDLKYSALYIDNISVMISTFTAVEFMIQANDETEFLWKAFAIDRPPPNVSILFDASCGTGQAIVKIPKPYAHIPCGYAGGISPSNINSVLDSIAEVVGEGTLVWIDMESSLRARDGDDADKDAFNTSACLQCISAVRESPYII